MCGTDVADMPQPGSGDPLAGHGQTSDKGQSQFLRYAALSNAGYTYVWMCMYI